MIVYNLTRLKSDLFCLSIFYFDDIHPYKSIQPFPHVKLQI